MSKSVKKVALLVGVAALAFTGIGLLAVPGVTLGTTAIAFGATNITLGMVATLGLGLVGLGTTPSLEQSIERTGANSRGRAFVDPNAEGAYIFGRTTVPLAMVYEQLHGVNRDRVSNVMAHAWHEIEAYVSLYVEGDLVTLSGDDATGDWAGILEWRRNLGNAGQTAIAISELSGGEFNWPSDATFEGVAHSALTWNFFADPEGEKISGGVPSQVDIVVDGAMLYDPREDPAYGSGSQDFADPTTWTFNNGNAVLVLLRFLIGEKTAGGDLIWGRGATETEINLDNFAAMASVCDETVDSIERFRLGGMHLLDGNFEGFVARWEHETGGKLYKVGGIYHVWVPHDDLTSLTTITEDDLMAGVPVQTSIAGIETLYNTARGRYIEPTEGYKAFPYPQVSESTAVTEDGGLRILPYDFSWVQDVSIAERIARILVRRSRFNRTWTIAMDWRGQGPNYAPFTVHTLNIPETGNDAQLVRVIHRSEPQQGITVLTLQQEDESIYDDTVALGDPHASNTIPNRIGRLGTIVPRYINGGVIWRDSWTPVLTNVTRDGSTYTKTGGAVNTFDSSVSSEEAYQRCVVAFTVVEDNTLYAIGLNADPATDHALNSIDGCWYIDGSTADAYVYHSGSSVAGGWAYASGDRFSIVRDNSEQRYFQNGVLRYSAAVTAAVRYLDSSFYSLGASVTNLQFGPVESVGTGLIDSEAATEVYQAENAAAGSFSGTTDGEAWQGSLTITLDVVPEDVIEIAASARIEVTLSGSATGYGGLQAAYWQEPAGGIQFAGALVPVDAGTPLVGSVTGSVTGLSGSYRFGFSNYMNKTGGTGTLQTSTSGRTLIVTRVKR